MKTRNLIATLALTLGVTGGAHAAVSFDPDGAGPLGAMSIGAFDWGPTGIFADGGVDAIGDFVASGGTCEGTGINCTFDLYTHAKVVGFLDDGGGALTNPAGLNSTFEITMIGHFREIVTGVNVGSGNADFAVIPGAGGNFLEIYFDNAADSIDVDGAGFNDGRLILNGSTIPAPGQESGFNSDPTEIEPLDGTGADNYDPAGAPPTQLTVTGFGSSENIPFDTLTQDFAFFLTQLEEFGITFANISLGLPYISVDPSDCYTGAAAGAGSVGSIVAGGGCAADHLQDVMAGQVVPAAPGILPVIGAVNGLGGPNGGPDFVAQSDFNSPLAGVPEPGSLALLGLGLGALGLGFRRRGLGLRLS
jgi:hypothetical protein